MGSVRSGADRLHERGPGGEPDEIHANLLETADYWLSVGLVLGLREPDQARQLLHVIEAYEAERGELARDAKSLIGQVFE